MITCTRRLTFAAGHRVAGHENKCRNMHGHNYVVYVTAQAEELDSIGRVIDFGVLKERLGGWLDFMWDHGFLYLDTDLEVTLALARVNDQKVYPMPRNPTAENLASELLLVICPKVLAGTGVTAVRVVVEETENCSAEATL